MFALATMSPEALHSLRWWMSDSNLLQGSPFRLPSPSLHVFMDASSEGWGAHLDFQEISGQWEGPSSLWHINRQEMYVVWLALSHWLDRCQGQSVLVATDNSTVVAYINKQGGTHSLPLCHLAMQILLWAHKHNIVLRARHIPGRLNILADSLSRQGQLLPLEWSLSPVVFSALS